MKLNRVMVTGYGLTSPIEYSRILELVETGKIGVNL